MVETSKTARTVHLLGPASLSSTGQTLALTRWLQRDVKLSNIRNKVTFLWTTIEDFVWPGIEQQLKMCDQGDMTQSKGTDGHQ